MVKKKKFDWNDPDNVLQAVSSMIEKIRADPNPLQFIGAFSSLVNAWCNVKKVSLEVYDVREVLARLEAIEKTQQCRM
jgi:hypothetical protein